MNPFDDIIFTEHKNTTYKSFVESQIMTLAVDESKKVDIGGGRVEKFRMNISKVSAENFRKFKTRTDKDGNLWVMRVE